jgi:hypothetical protein
MLSPRTCRSLLAAFGPVSAVSIVCCAHVNYRPCPSPRAFARRPPTVAPTDAETLAAVAATGARYEICPRRTEYILGRDGEHELDAEGLHRLTEGLSRLGTGTHGAGIGGIGCTFMTGKAGAVFSVPEHTLTPVQIAEALRDLSEPTASARVQVTILSAPGPRCAPDDPACGPVPYPEGEFRCAEGRNADSHRERRVEHGYGGTPGRCSYDGECNVTGCGNDCRPTSEIDGPGTCELRENWRGVYCGCVDSACAWLRFKTR